MRINNQFNMKNFIITLCFATMAFIMPQQISAQKNENAHHAIHAQADGAHTRSDKNHRQDNGQFKKEECGFHNIS